MSHDPIDQAVLLAALGAGLSLSAESESGVLANAALLRARLAEFSDIPLPDDLDPAPLLAF